jgi:hypothetical protein
VSWWKVGGIKEVEWEHSPPNQPILNLI